MPLRPVGGGPRGARSDPFRVGDARRGHGLAAPVGARDARSAPAPASLRGRSLAQRAEHARRPAMRAGRSAGLPAIHLSTICASSGGRCGARSPSACVGGERRRPLTISWAARRAPQLRAASVADLPSRSSRDALRCARSAIACASSAPKAHDLGHRRPPSWRAHVVRMSRRAPRPSGARRPPLRPTRRSPAPRSRADASWKRSMCALAISPRMFPRPRTECRLVRLARCTATRSGAQSVSAWVRAERCTTLDSARIGPQHFTLTHARLAIVCVRFVMAWTRALVSS